MTDAVHWAQLASAFSLTHMCVNSTYKYTQTHCRKLDPRDSTRDSNLRSGTHPPADPELFITHTQARLLKALRCKPSRMYVLLYHCTRGTLAIKIILQSLKILWRIKWEWLCIFSVFLSSELFFLRFISSLDVLAYMKNYRRTRGCNLQVCEVKLPWPCCSQALQPLTYFEFMVSITFKVSFQLKWNFITEQGC